MTLYYYDVMAALNFVPIITNALWGIPVMPLVMVESAFLVYVSNKGIVFQVTFPHFYQLLLSCVMHTVLC